jgi:hypothetical protein
MSSTYFLKKVDFYLQINTIKLMWEGGTWSSVLEATYIFDTFLFDSLYFLRSALIFTVIVFISLPYCPPF